MQDLEYKRDLIHNFFYLLQKLLATGRSFRSYNSAKFTIVCLKTSLKAFFCNNY